MMQDRKKIKTKAAVDEDTKQLKTLKELAELGPQHLSDGFREAVKWAIAKIDR